MTTIPDHRPLLREAVLLERARRLPEAAAAYERLLARWPDLPDSWYNLAVLQRKLGRFDAALASYQQALDRGVSRPEEVHLNRGVIYSDCLRQDDAAERELQTALALNPDYVPALLNLANLKSDLGRARRGARDLRKDPGHRSPLLRGPGALRESQARLGAGRSADREAATGARGLRAPRRRTRRVSASRSARCSMPAAPTIRRSRPMPRPTGTAAKVRRRGAVLYDRRRRRHSSIS